ncbi:hypothetical protein FRX31_025083 [Thalictrum thalictroides]|uniref:F-box associated beta-propeller type 3 domain-containing protein n=1 Tax=Thalictrum thalictroides TaxID=46969 RepID=A0A7J6VMG2_THATH|nr:hypothetical protein FRX31_025083 [Thalictrum thalictroides]
MFMDLKGLESDSAHQIDSLPDNFEVQCQCNGLILVKETCSGIYYVTNPTTKETISLPSCKHRCLQYMTEVRWDIVYVPSTKTYKVVEFAYDFELKSSALHIQTLCALSTCSDSWRPIKNINSILSYYTRISVNGILYMETGENEPIVSFDVGDETTVRVFRFTVENYYHSKWLIKMDGLPALIGRPCWGSAEYDVWI